MPRAKWHKRSRVSVRGDGTGTAAAATGRLAISWRAVSRIAAGTRERRMRTSWVPALLLAVACAATAQTNSDPLSTRAGWEAGVQGARYRYEEPNFAKITGNRAGLVAAYTVVEDRWFTRFDARYSYGSLKYEGSGTQNNVPDTIFEARAVTGADFVLGRGAALSPFFGLGYRYLYDDLRGYGTVGNNAFFGYRRYSQYVYAPIGTTLRLHAGGGWMVAPTVEYDIFIRGRQLSKLTDTGFAGSQDITNEQKHGWGYRASLMVENDRLAFGPWAHYWRIKDSDVSGGGFEPANRTREVGLEIRYRF
jgi:hypothetical protein